MFSGFAAKRMEHNECLIWQVADFSHFHHVKCSLRRSSELYV